MCIRDRHWRGPVQAQRTGDITLETGDTDAHIGRVAKRHQPGGEGADDQADEDDSPA